MEKLSVDQVYIPSDKIITRLIENELIIVPIEADTVDFDHSLYSLTNTGRQVWQRLNRDTTVDMLCTDLCATYDASYETIVHDVLELLAELLERRLIIRLK